MECGFHGMRVSWNAGFMECGFHGMRGLMGCAVPCAKISCAELPATARQPVAESARAPRAVRRRAGKALRRANRQALLERGATRSVQPGCSADRMQRGFFHGLLEPIRGNGAHPGKRGPSGKTGPIIRGNRAHPSMPMSLDLPRKRGVRRGGLCGERVGAMRLRFRNYPVVREERSGPRLRHRRSGHPDGLFRHGEGRFPHGKCRSRPVVPVGLPGVPNRANVVPSSHVQV